MLHQVMIPVAANADGNEETNVVHMPGAVVWTSTGIVHDEEFVVADIDAPPQPKPKARRNAGQRPKPKPKAGRHHSR